MNSKESRKQAILAFKERKPFRGAFAVRCTATGRIWVGSGPNLTAAHNGAWFSLRLGSHHDRTLQHEWDTYGEAAFQYEVLEQLEDDASPLAVRDLLKEAKARWAARLGASPLL